MRLIDADALKENVKYQAGICRLLNNDAMKEYANIMEFGFCKEIDNAPTITLLEKEDNPDWLPFEEYDSISTSDERAEILNTITEAIENKNFWVAGYDDTDGVFLKVLLMKGDKE